ncbi:MAG: hypothetical protein HYX40_05535 [Sphingobacteriales bacterium]|nr:hypothetical protein [Sphingobacteriales bacterium]
MQSEENYHWHTGILYLVTTSGVVVTIHYCMGKISSADYGVANVHFCDKCGIKESGKKKGCCHSENKIYKIDDSHNFVKASSDLVKITATVPGRIINAEQPVHDTETLLALQYHSPPDKRRTVVYLYNNVFRI